MQPDFVYIRFAILFGLLFLFLHRFVRMALRGDIGVARERGSIRIWIGPFMTHWFQGEEQHHEVAAIDHHRAYRAPVLICSTHVFALCLRNGDGHGSYFYANMFGGFVSSEIFTLGGPLSQRNLSKQIEYAKMARRQQMQQVSLPSVWYSMGLPLSRHFLPIWYGNLQKRLSG
jgi:hypothetical protein